jgi:pilus assembly protein CpaB
MRARTLILLFVAVLLAGGTAFLARAWLAAERSKELAEAAPMALPTPAKSVLVARADITRGQILRPDQMVWQTWPEGGLDKNYVVMGGPRTPDAFAGWVAKNTIAGGEPVTESKIIAPGNRGFLAAVLRPGMRAISIPVTITSGISGFIFPGDEVDLLVTYAVPSATGDDKDKDKKSTYDHKAAETVLRTVRVVAIDQRLESKAGEAVPAHTATFEVTPKQSEVILLASEIGKVSLILRSLVPDPPETPDAQAAVSPRADAVEPDRQIVASPIAAPGVATIATPIAATTTASAAGRTSGSPSGTPLRTAQAVTVLPGPPTDSAPAKAASGAVRVVTPSAPAPDTSPGASATYTLDNEISKLLPQPKGEKDNPEPPKLWVCKGPSLNCSTLTADSEGDRFLQAFKELKSQGATFTPGR